VESKPRLALLAVIGLLLAAGIGVAAYAVSKDSVGLPVTKLDPKPLAPTTATQPRPATTRSATTRPATTVVDDHGGGGDDHSGRGRGGGHGGGGDD
jgi:hypothetical protein